MREQYLLTPKNIGNITGMKEEMIEVTILGVETTVTRYQPCKRCKDPKGATWGSMNGIPGHYPQPCFKCQSTKEYYEEEKKKKKEVETIKHVNHALKAGKPTAVYQHQGHDFFTNYKGEVIKYEKSKPRPAGQKDWKM